MHRSRIGPRAPAAALAAAFVLAACASAPPTAQLAVSDAALASAQGAGAPQYAPVELRSARQHLEAARVAMREGDNDEARRLAEAAEVDAKLAESRTHAAKAQAAAAELQASIAALRQELERAPR